MNLKKSGKQRPPEFTSPEFKTFQKPMAEGVKLFQAVQEVYLTPEITVA